MAKYTGYTINADWVPKKFIILKVKKVKCNVTDNSSITIGSKGVYPPQVVSSYSISNHSLMHFDYDIPFDNILSDITATTRSLIKGDGGTTVIAKVDESSYTL